VTNPFDPTDPDSVFAFLDSATETQPSPNYENAIAAVIRLLEGGNLELADSLGRVLIAPGRSHDAASAYRWFYIGLSQQGYTTHYDNEYESLGTSYLGPIGDFRNEDEVSICIAELGLAALPELDKQAQNWLASGDLTMWSSGPAGRCFE